MDNKKDELESLKKKKHDIEDRLGKLSENSWKFEQEIRELKRQIVFEENLLNETTWILVIRNTSYDSGSTFHLESEKHDEPKRAVDLYEDRFGGHWAFYLSEDDDKEYVEFRGDDGDITLHFENDKTGLEFIKSQNLKVDPSACKKRVQDLKNSTEAYETLLKEFGK